MFSENRGSRFELRVESFNTCNHTEFNGVRSQLLRSSNFGTKSLPLGIRACSNSAQS